MPESFIPVWMSVGEAESAVAFIRGLPDFVEHPEHLYDTIHDALEEERPRSFAEMERERGTAVQFPPCTCPVGFGAVVAENCPRHNPRPAHTISGLPGDPDEPF